LGLENYAAMKKEGIIDYLKRFIFDENRRLLTKELYGNN